MYSAAFTQRTNYIGMSTTDSLTYMIDGQKSRLCELGKLVPAYFRDGI